MSQSNNELKENIRIADKKIRESLDIKSLSTSIMQKVLDLQEFKSAKAVFVYISFGTELDTSLLLSQKGKKIFVPKIINDEMFMVEYTPNKLQKNKFGIFEPVENKFYTPNKTDVVICPALACDLNFYRLGYGKGYYDKFLSKYDCVKILPIPSKLVCDDIGHDKFDVPVDIIVTENGVFRRN